MSFDYTGSFSGSFSGEILASNGVISSSAQVVANLPSGVVSSSAQVTYGGTGLISSSNQISYTGITNKPTTISAFQKNSIVANNRFREVTYPTDSASFNERINTLEVATDETGSDSQTLSISGDQLTIAGGNTVTIPTGSEAQTLSFNDATNALTISDGNSVDLSSLSGGGGGGSGTALTASDEGGVLSKNVRSIDFVGNAVTATNSGNALTVTIGTGSLPSGIISQSGGIVDLSGVKIQYSNVYSNIGDLPSASDYHGMFAHVHGTGKAYYAHGGNWIELANASGNISSSTQVEAIIDDTYISASAAASGFGQGGGSGDITAVIAGDGIGGGANSGDATIFLDTSSVHFRLGVSASAALYGFGSGGGGGSFGDPPTFDQDGLQVNEFVASGSTIGTLTVTDVTPGDTATFEIQSGYTDDFFKISSGGVVTANTLVTSSMNTTAGSGSNNSHPFLVKVTDGQNNVVEETIYIYVRPNSAPVFRQTSVNGSIITDFTSSAVNENSTDGSTIATIYFTDENSDTITIRTGSVSPADHFNYTINSTNVVITQDTASLDYETYTSYTLSLTASDEHYESGDDDNSFTTLSIRIPVQDNNPPVVNDQTLNSINENSANNAVVDSIAASDSEGDTITWGNFTLLRAYVNGVGTNVTSSLGGTSLYDPNSNPFDLNASNGQVTRKSGVFLNADVADRYEYRVTVTDNFNSDNDTGVITIPIADDAASSIGTDGNTYYIQEGAESGDNLTTNTNGYSSGDVTFTSAVSQMWEVNSVPSGYVRFTNGYTYYTGSSVTLEVDTDISGNLFFADSDTVAIQITASETAFETTKQYRDHTLTITDNQPYSIVFTDTDDNLNTNGGRPSNTLTTITFTEPQSGIGDTIDHDQFSFVDASGQLTASKSGNTYLVSAKTNLSGSTDYDFTASIADSYGNITTDSHSITIAQAPVGTLSENGTFYVIESATSGDNIVLGTNGRTGTQGDLGVSYSPQYNSAAVASFTSSNEYIGVNSSGNLTVSSSISGSANTYPGTITSDITWRDQYDNVGGPQTITVNLAINNAPSAAELTSTNRNENQATDGNLLSTIKWTDTEGDALNISSFTLTGVSASNLSSSYDGSNNFGLYANGDQSAGTISFTASVEDVHGFRTGVYTDDITIAQADSGSLTNPGNLFIIESATNGDGITNTTTGIGTAKTLSVTYSPNYGSQLAQNFTSDNPFIAVNSSTGVLTVGTDISGSYTQGATLTAVIGWEDQYGNTNGDQITVSVTANQAPSVTTDTPNNANWNTNLATDGALLATLVWSDTEGDALNVDSFNLTGAGASSLSSSYNGSNTFGIYANGDRSAGTISYTANVEDEHGFSTGTYADNIVVSQAGGGSITSENFYIIESAVSGAVITNDSDGIGTQADVNVGYSTNYGSQVAEQFNSNHSVIAIDSDGNLSVKSDISGSYNNGDSISPTIYWEDQYGNEGTGSITINISNNVLPSATFSNETVNAPVSAGTKLVTITISDTELDSPYSVTLSGEGAASMSLAPQNAASSSWFINASDSSMTGAVTLNYTASIQDAYGSGSVEYKQEFPVGAAPAGGNGLWYAYLTEYSQYIGVYGDDFDMYGDGDILGGGNDDGVLDNNSIFDSFADGEMGASVISDTYGQPTLSAAKTFLIASGSILSASISTPLLDTVLHNTGSNSSTGLLIVFPSSSDIGLLPDSMGSSQGDNTAGRYLIWGDNSNSDGLRSFKVRYFDMNGSNTYTNTSDTRFGVIFGGDSSQGGSGIDYYLLTASGSYSLPNNK